ncbi:serine protease AprX [Scopulibacillus darangshiensis]|uniref:Serine protease AprX n=1 Tax=Scopulibacillus darangshiensis TaxID=442528 RepID=A0A4R2NJR8_9BACL|nr:S8/S53 family peptidase [Scopulibacillus darangshiensis]TCP21485.1 serine protease AprX [Scopulibacillus darangshiensis]
MHDFFLCPIDIFNYNCKIIVHDDFSIEVQMPAFEEPEEIQDFEDEHGLLTVLSLAHQPCKINGKLHTGISPAATFLVLNHGAFREGEGERLQKGINWLLEKREQWNIKIVLSMGWHALDNPHLLKNTRYNSTVKALAPVLEKDILVVCSNGNSRITNIRPPVEYLAVGGYNDRGSADIKRHVPHTDEPWGPNGDGHMRPDILGPRTYLPVPIHKKEGSMRSVVYYSGTSGSGTLIAGICAYLFSKFPHSDSQLLKNVLKEQGDYIDNYDNPAPKVNVSKVLKALETGYTNNVPPQIKRPIIVENPTNSLQSKCEIERALALSYLVEQSLCSRKDLWMYTLDPTGIVRNIAVSGLHKPAIAKEREKFWAQLHTESEGGVRGLYMYGLLQGATANEIESWISWANDENWSVRWCVDKYLLKYSEFPKFDLTPDPDLIAEKANALNQAYKQYKNKISSLQQ